MSVSWNWHHSSSRLGLYSSRYHIHSADSTDVQNPNCRLKVTVSFAETLQTALGSTLSLRSTNHHDYHDDYDISNHDINRKYLYALFFFQCVNYTFEWIPNTEWFTPLFNLSTPLAEINNASRPVRKSRASKTTNICLNISNLQLVLILSIADWSVSMRAPWYGLEWHRAGMLCNRTFVFFSKLFSQHYK